MEKYIIMLVYLAVPFNILYLINQKQKKAILISILFIIMSLPITIAIATGNRPPSIASLIARLLSPITKQ
jgi:hypothetical protein